MIRDPISPTDTPPTPSTDLARSTPPVASVGVVFASLFPVLAFYHGYLTIWRKTWFTWTSFSASILSCMSFVAYAYNLTFDTSTVWFALEGLAYP
jgi:hypothetical protein